MKLGREVSRHNELDNWRNTHRFESVMATKWLLLTISETEPGLWDRLQEDCYIVGQGLFGLLRVFEKLTSVLPPLPRSVALDVLTRRTLVCFRNPAR